MIKYIKNIFLKINKKKYLFNYKYDYIDNIYDLDFFYYNGCIIKNNNIYKINYDEILVDNIYNLSINKLN
jgi:hypothetical protein